MYNSIKNISYFSSSIMISLTTILYSLGDNYLHCQADYKYTVYTKSRRF